MTYHTGQIFKHRIHHNEHVIITSTALSNDGRGLLEWTDYDHYGRTGMLTHTGGTITFNERYEPLSEDHP